MGEADASGTDPRRLIPSVEQVLRRPAVRDLEPRFGRDAVLREVRAILGQARSAAAEGSPPGVATGGERFDAELRARLEAAAGPSLVTVINATGVVIHTNLGRAPLSPEASLRVAAVASSYSNLEYDLVAGERGSRDIHAEARLCHVLATEAAVVVNNNAAAVLLAVNTLAEGREVLVSRGELVEIGGSFRIPDVVGKGGARLREVGTTNRTRVGDYEAALSPAVAMILRVHPSNFRIVGFTESASLAELVALGRRSGIPVVEDLGSGLLTPLPDLLPGEPTARESLAGGADIITFSGDKLLGGPQAGLMAGRADLLAAARRNPLYRALRVDKMTLAALDSALAEHESGRALTRVPVLQMLVQTAAEVRRRCEALAAALVDRVPGVEVSVLDVSSAVGGGAAPTAAVPSAALAVRVSGRSPDEIASALRRSRTPVVARVADDRLVLDLRTVRQADDVALLRALAECAATPARPSPEASGASLEG
jgi:L-seryl-tRNA(Ser) seleniumtransferase